MPGKVNPVIPEAMSQVCFHVIGNDTTVAMAAESGQLNAVIWDSVINFSILESIQVLSRGFAMLNKHCLVGITANRDRCRKQVEKSVSKLTACLPLIGYERCSAIAEEALERNVSVEEVLKEKKLLSYSQINQQVFSDAALLNEPAGTFKDAWNAGAGAQGQVIALSPTDVARISICENGGQGGIDQSGLSHL